MKAFLGMGGKGFRVRQQSSLQLNLYAAVQEWVAMKVCVGF